ncbi:MAG: hypothetical protein P8L44_09865 [Opitutales bacterium]|nr:hypothetical protein [Opitutales bacterium]
MLTGAPEEYAFIHTLKNEKMMKKIPSTTMIATIDSTVVVAPITGIIFL